MEKLKVVELFAGIGAWSKALENLNIDHEVLMAVENDEMVMRSYNLIHNSDYKPIDINDVNLKEVPDCNIICYSPPCQPFSSAGKQLGFEDKRGILFFDALRIIKEKKPKYALMENVKGLTQTKFEFEFNTMLTELEKAGYKNYWKVLNSINYGVPQVRERLFIVSIRNDIIQDFEFSSYTYGNLKMKNILDDEVENKYYITDERATKTIGNLPFKKVSKQNIHKVFNVHPSGKGMNGWVYDSEGLSPTLTTNKSEGIKIIHNNQVRRMTDKEALRLMGFSDIDYHRLKNGGIQMSPIYKMAGNSIVVDVCESLFKNIFKDNYTKEN